MARDFFAKIEDTLRANGYTDQDIIRYAMGILQVAEMGKERRIEEVMERIYGGLQKEGWGDIDPSWFKRPESDEFETEDSYKFHKSNYRSLKQILTDAIN